MGKQKFIAALWLSAAALPSLAQSIVPTVIARGLDHPWALAFLPDGKFLITERSGALRVIEANGRINAPVAGLPDIAVGGQGGLLDVIVDHDFARNRTIYFCFSEPDRQRKGNSTALASARLSPDSSQLTGLSILFSQRPKLVGEHHFGCRIVENRDHQGRSDGSLFLTLGERFSRRDDAQTLDNHHGKVIRINKDGSIPDENPLISRPGALPEIWSYGHRNPQGATLSPGGVLWIHEHGPRGGDELNLPRPGGNYGWPLVSFGRNYDFTAVGSGQSAQPGTEAPRHHWTPSIAPSGMTFVTTEKYGKDWVGNLLVGSLKFKHITRLVLERPFEGKVIKEIRLLEALGARVRDVRQGPDGFIYIVTDDDEGQLIRLSPKSNADQ